VLFTREFYADCARCLEPGGLLVTQNGLPFLQAGELNQSVSYFRELFADAYAYLATTPSYFGGPMSYGWATDNAELRHHRRKKIERRWEKAGGFPTRYWSPEVHVAAFALPAYVGKLVEAKP
jgi:spermidine synthase